MNLLIIRNAPREGAGTIEGFLNRNRIGFVTVDIFEKQIIPEPDPFNGLIILGGPMSVNDEKEYPWLAEEMALIEKFASKGRKILGICLGAQLIAKVFGARVYPGSLKESGWHEIELTSDGLRDPVFRKFAVHPHGGDIWRRFKVFQWHGETFDIPGGAVRLAGSALYPNQAFRYGHGVYALQFHPEVTKEMVYGWMEEDQADMHAIRAETERYYETFIARSFNLYETLFRSNGGMQ